jgi:hypothetical protein
MLGGETWRLAANIDLALFNLGLDSSCAAPIWSACASDDQLYFVHCELG